MPCKSFLVSPMWCESHFGFFSWLAAKGGEEEKKEESKVCCSYLVLVVSGDLNRLDTLVNGISFNKIFVFSSKEYHV